MHIVKNIDLINFIVTTRKKMFMGIGNVYGLNGLTYMSVDKVRFTVTVQRFLQDIMV